MKAGGKFNIDNSTENVISGFEYAASALSYLYEDITSSSGSLAACLPVITEKLQEIYACSFDVLHITSPTRTLSEFFQNYLARRTPETQRVGGMSLSGRANFLRNGFNKERVRILQEGPRSRGYSDYGGFGGWDDDSSIPGRDSKGRATNSPFSLEFSQNGGFVFENATANDFIVQVVMKQKEGANYGEFLLNNLVNSGNSFFSELTSVSDMKALMNANPDKFNKNLNSALQDSFVDKFTELYIEAVGASGNDAARLLNISVDWKQDRTVVTCDIGIIIQDFRM